MDLKVFIPGLAIILIALVSINQSKHISHFFLSTKQVEQKSFNKLATIKSFSGIINIKDPIHNTTSTHQLDRGKAIPLGHKNIISIDNGSSAVVEFISGYTITFYKDAEFILEARNPEEKTPLLYVSLISGNYKMNKKGASGTLYLVDGANIFTPEAQTDKQLEALILKSEPGETEEVLNELSENASEETIETEETPESIIPEGSPLKMVEQTIINNSSIFQRCQTNSLRNESLSTGDSLFEITLVPEGKIRELKVIKTNIKDEQLQKCTENALRNITFKKFEGEAITFSYPIKYE